MNDDTKPLAQHGEQAPLDLLGRELKVGDHVVYNVVQRRTSRLRHGIVKKLESNSALIFNADMGTSIWKSCASTAAIVLPDIQNPLEQLGDLPDETQSA